MPLRKIKRMKGKRKKGEKKEEKEDSIRKRLERKIKEEETRGTTVTPFKYNF